jgi:pimeloyl-ACP methyl ester carboxylesterase
MHIRVEGIKLFFDVEGAKLRPHGPSMSEVPTLLLLHGGPGFDHSLFKPAFAQIADLVQVVYLDMRGHGRSDSGPVTQWSLEQWAQDVYSFCEALSIEAPIVLGHSFGGIVAMLYATRYPEHPSRLILSSTSAQPTGDRSFEIFERLGGPGARDAAIAFWTNPNEEALAAYQKLCVPLYTRTAGLSESFRRVMRNPAMRLFFIEDQLQRLDLLHQMHRIRCPTLLIGGEDDPITPIGDMEDIAVALRQDLLKFERFPDAGHGVYRDRPDAFFRVLRDFISGLDED